MSNCERSGVGMETYSVMGTMKSHFFAGVYCAPSSICSHKVKLSYTPPCRSE